MNDFLVKYCNNKLEDLLTLDIGILEDDKDFGKPEEYGKSRTMDPDDSIIVRAVLYLLYNEEIQDLTYDKIGNDYRGDTIFTPGNIFGKSFDFLKKQYIEDEDLYIKKVKDFLKMYHTIPNMILLPNRKIEVIRRNWNVEYISYESLNQYRGMNNPGLSDYIDLFIKEICSCIEDTNSTERDIYIVQLFEKNFFYFNEFKKCSQFLHSHLLDDIVYKVDDTYKITDYYDFKHLVYWKKTEKYTDEINKFLNAFERLWTFRKEKILDKLKKCLL